jgi:hypothetical protein
MLTWFTRYAWNPVRNQCEPQDGIAVVVCCRLNGVFYTGQWYALTPPVIPCCD